MILHDQTTDAFLEALKQVWRTGSDSFTILPQRTDLTEDWIAQSLKVLPGPLQKDHFLLSTSGSTGAPKLLVASRDRAHAMAELIARHQGLGHGDTAIMTLPLSYCFSFVNQWVLAQQIGSKHVFARLSDPVGFTRALQAVENGMLCLVAAQVPLLKALGQQRFPQIKNVAFAGSPFPWKHTRSLVRLFPNAQFFDNYGCAEAMPRLIIRDVTAHVVADTTPPPGADRHPVAGHLFAHH